MNDKEHFSLVTPFPQIFNAENFLFEKIKSDRSTSRFYENDCPFGMTFFRSDPEQKELLIKIEEYCHCFFQVVLESHKPLHRPPSKDISDIKMQLSLKTQWTEEKNIYIQRFSWIRRLGQDSAWKELKTRAAPFPIQWLQKCVHVFGETEALKKISIELNSTTDQQIEVERLEEIYKPLVEFLAYPPKVLKKAWNTLLHIEQTILNAEAALLNDSPPLLAQSPAIVKQILNREVFENTRGAFIDRYDLLLQDFKQSIQVQKQKLQKTSLLILKQLQNSKELSALDPLLDIYEKLKKTGGLASELLLYSDLLEPQDIDDLFCLVAQQGDIRWEELGSYTICFSPLQPCNLQLKVGMGCCRIDEKKPLEVQGMTFPLSKATTFAPKADIFHYWPHYRGVSASTIWRYNIAGYRIFQYEHMQLSSYKSLLPSVPKIKTLTNVVSEALPYDPNLQSLNDNIGSLNLLICPFEIVVSELEQIKKQQPILKNTDELQLANEWSVELATQGFYLLKLLTTDWKNLSEGIQHADQAEGKDTQTLLKLLHIASKFVLWIDSNLEDLPKLHQGMIHEFKNHLEILEKTTLNSYLTALQQGEQRHHSYWKEVLQISKETSSGQPSTVDPILTDLFQNYKEVDLDKACKALQQQTKTTQVQARELIRHFLEIKIYDISTLDHPLYLLLKTCDAWFKDSNFPSLVTIWEEFHSTKNGEKVLQILTHLDRPDLWPTNLTPEDFQTLSPLLKSKCIDYLKQILSHSHVMIKDAAPWEHLLFSLKDESLITLYLEKLATKKFLNLENRDCPHRKELMQFSKSFFNKFPERILGHFSLSLLMRNEETLATLQKYVQLFFDAKDQPAIYEKMDAACLTQLQQLYEASPPDSQIFVKSLKGYDYPKSSQGILQLNKWLLSLSPLPWNPAVWTFINHLSSKKEWKPVQAKWRLAWFKQNLERNLFTSSKEILGDIPQLSGAKCLDDIFDTQAPEAIRAMHTYKEQFKLWTLWDENLSDLYQRSTTDVMSLDSPLNSDLYKLSKLLTEKPFSLANSLLNVLVKNFNPAQLRALYQENFGTLFHQTMIEPSILPRAWVYDGLATLALACKDKEWTDLRKSLNEVFYQESQKIPQNHLKSPEIKQWIKRLQDLLEKTHLEPLRRWQKRLDNPEFESLLSGDPDWLLTHEEIENSPIFGHSEWQTIFFLPSSYKKKLFSFLTSFHLQNLTIYSLAAVSIAQQILFSNSFNSEESTKIEIYRAIAKAASTLRSLSAKENFEQLDQIIEDNHATERNWFAPMGVTSIVQQDERSQLWRTWNKKLEGLGIKKATLPSHVAHSWLLGPCKLDDALRDLLTSTDSSWKEMCFAARGIELVNQNVFIPGLLFHDLFLSIVCGYSSSPYDILKHDSSTPIILRQQLPHTRSFEHLAQLSEPWILEQNSFGALFLFDLLWGTEDQPSEYRFSPQAQGKNTFILYRSSRPSLTPPYRQNLLPVTPDVKQAASSISRSNQSKIKAPSFLYCCRSAMQLPLSSSLTNWILHLNPALTLDILLGGWNWYLQRLTQLYDPDVLTRERMLEWDSRFGGILWTPERVKNLLHRLSFLQTILRKNPDLTLEEILSGFDPLGAYHYTIFKENPLKMYHLLEQWPIINLTHPEVARIFHYASQKCGGIFSC